MTQQKSKIYIEALGSLYQFDNSEQRSNPVSGNPRDTQFAGFANLLFDQLSELGLIALVDMSLFRDHPEFGLEQQEKMNQLTRQIFAQRAYDFLVSSHFRTAMLATYEESEAVVKRVPDMTEWTKEQDV